MRRGMRGMGGMGGMRGGMGGGMGGMGGGMGGMRGKKGTPPILFALCVMIGLCLGCCSMSAVCKMGFLNKQKKR